MKTYFVTGIGTGVGKTICAAIITEALQADYWKPVQAGDLDHTDTDKVKQLISNPVSRFHAEQYRLKHAMSPHAAAELEGKVIDMRDFKRPETTNHLVVEGAGGLLVPLNSNGDLIIDLVKRLGAGVVLVSQNYLGSINHTLLSIEALEQRNLRTTGILFNGDPNPQTEEVILKRSNLPCIGRIPKVDQPNREFVREQAAQVLQFFNAAQ